MSNSRAVVHYLNLPCSKFPSPFTTHPTNLKEKGQLSASLFMFSCHFSRGLKTHKTTRNYTFATGPCCPLFSHSPLFPHGMMKFPKLFSPLLRASRPTPSRRQMLLTYCYMNFLYTRLFPFRQLIIQPARRRLLSAPVPSGALFFSP